MDVPQAGDRSRQPAGHPPAAFRYEFTSTVEDLLAAEEAERSAVIPGPLRQVIVILGAIWLVAGLVALVRQQNWQSLIWVGLGIAVVYVFVVRPRIVRDRIKTNNPEQRGVILDFADDCMRLGVSGVGQFTREWDELSGVADAEKGILFYFSDGVKSWLPNRVFASEAEREAFLKFVKGREARRHDAPG
jgi:hypothetical protein